MAKHLHTILVIGGTGFIGYHIVQTLLAHNCAVTVLCRNTEKATELFNGKVTAIAADIYTLQCEDYLPLLESIEGVVFAAGVDERSKIEGEPDDFFYRNNIWPCEQLFQAIAQSSVSKAVLLNSIFAWLNIQRPDLELTLHHPYIRSRVLQNQISQDALRDSNCILTTLQVPWIFGSSPHRASQWQGLVNYVRGAIPAQCINGGINVMSVQSLAQAVYGALQHSQTSSAVPVGDHNMNHVELMQTIALCAGRPDVRIRTLSDNFFRDITTLGGFFHDVFGLEAGLDLSHLSSLLLQEICFDSSESKALLGYQGGDWLNAIQETVDTVEESSLMSGWRKWLNWIEK